MLTPRVHARLPARVRLPRLSLLSLRANQAGAATGDGSPSLG